MDGSETMVADGDLVIDLVFSSDDEMRTGKGFYFHCYDFRDGTSKDLISKQSWRNREGARRALKAGSVTWK